MLKINFLFVLVLLAGQAKAQTFISGNDLLDDCTATTGPKTLYCMGYVVGALDMAAQSGHDVRGWKFCLPDTVTQVQMMDVVTSWLEQNPTQRHLAASNAILQSMRLGFPCE
jgi:hypothetical protein